MVAIAICTRALGPLRGLSKAEGWLENRCGRNAGADLARVPGRAAVDRALGDGRVVDDHTGASPPIFAQAAEKGVVRVVAGPIGPTVEAIIVSAASLPASATQNYDLLARL